MNEDEIIPGRLVEFPWHTACGTVLYTGRISEKLDDGMVNLFCYEYECDLKVRADKLIPKRQFEVYGDTEKTRLW